VVRASNLQPIGRRFGSRPLHFKYDLGQVVHTHGLLVFLMLVVSFPNVLKCQLAKQHKIMEHEYINTTKITTVYTVTL